MGGKKFLEKFNKATSKELVSVDFDHVKWVNPVVCAYLCS